MKFSDVLTQLGVPFKSEGKDTRSGWLQLRCPRCGGDPYLGWNISFGYWHCWRCGGLPTEQILTEICSASRRDIKALLDAVDHERPPEDLVKTGRLALPNGIGPLRKAHKAYLRSRGLDAETWHLWGLQGIGLSLKLAWRIYIPISYGGQVVSWTTRSIRDDDHARYISASPEQEAMPHKELIFGFDFARHGIGIVEGPMDAIALGPGGGCLFGVGYKRAQLEYLCRFPVRAIWFDNEPKAQQRARKLADLLAPFPGKTYNVQVDAKDPSSALLECPKEIKRFRRLFLE